jgi:hypothetical protein
VTISKRPERLFLQLFMHRGEKDYEIRERSSRKSGRSIEIDFRSVTYILVGMLGFAQMAILEHS